MDLSTSPTERGEEKAGPRDLAARLSDRVAAADPAFSRLRLASRAMLTLAISGGALALLTLLHQLPVAAYGLTVVLSFIGALAVRDRDPRAQAMTRLHAGWAASLSAVFAGTLAPEPVVADIVFLVVIFGSVYIRRFGARWFAVGMVTFLAYFMGDYLKPAPSQAGWIVLAAAVALTASHVVSTLLLPDDPERDFRRAMTTIDHRINLILRHLLRMADGGSSSDTDTKALRAHVLSLRDIVLMAEGFIPKGSTGALAAEGAPSDLATALFDLQLAVERLVRARHEALPRPAMVRALLDERGSLLREAPRDVAQAGGAPTLATHLLLRLRDARVRINRALGTAPSPAFREPEESGAAPASTPGAAAPEKDEATARPRIPETLHRPIQVTLACALALGAGMMISPTGWYWAVITAFIVFNNTRSRADTAMRALQRSAGTLGGILVGTACATLLQGHLVASGLAIPVLFFLAFYFLQTSYGVMIFFVTIAIALLYGLMGMFTPQLLVVRLEETVIGALAGTFAAFAVFPVSTTRGVDGSVSAFMDALAELVSASRDRAREGKEAKGLTALSRTLDRRSSELAAAAGPLSAPWSAVTRFGQVRRKLLPFAGSAHWGRVLAQSLDAEAPLPEEEARRFDTLADDVDEEIRTARDRGADLFVRRRDRRAPPDTPTRPMEPPAPGNEEALRALEAIRDMMRRLNGGAGGDSATRV